MPEHVGQLGAETRDESRNFLVFKLARLPPTQRALAPHGTFLLVTEGELRRQNVLAIVAAGLELNTPCVEEGDFCHHLPANDFLSASFFEDENQRRRLENGRRTIDPFLN